MLKWTSKGNKTGRPVLGFGLEEKNLEELRKGRPIIAKVKIGGQECDVVIHYGDTQAKMLADLKGAGILTSDTNVTTLPQVQ